MSDTAARIQASVYAAIVWFALGFAAGGYYRAPSAAPGPAPPVPITVSPDNPTKNPAHTGHFTVSYIEPRYPTPASAAVRDQLAGTDWRALDATFRAYVVGQVELTTLGLDKHFDPSDLPIALIQETGPAGAPLVGTPLKPASAAAVLNAVKGLRGQ